MVERGLRVAAIPGGEAVLRAEPRAGRRCWWTWGGAGRPAGEAVADRTFPRRAVELVPGGGGEAGSRTAVARQAEGKAALVLVRCGPPGGKVAAGGACGRGLRAGPAGG